MPENQRRWNDVRDAMLRRLYIDEGNPARVVGELMGCSRNAILGRAYRLGISRFERTEITHQNAKRARTVRARKAPVRPPKPIIIELAPVTTEAKPLLALGRWECRNPVGEGAGEATLFCAAPTAPGRNYCALCASLLFKPLTPRDIKLLQRVASYN